MKKYILFIGFGLSLCFLFLAFTGLLSVQNEKKGVLGAEDEITKEVQSSGSETSPVQEQMRVPAGDSQQVESPAEEVPTDIMLLTCTPTPSNTPKPTKTPKPTNTAGPSPTRKPSHTPTPTSKYSPTPTKTPTPTRKPTKGPSPTPTYTPTKKPTKTPTPTAPTCWCTLTPAARATLTAAAAHPSAVPTHTGQEVTPTVVYTNTPSPVPSPTETITPSLTPTFTLTPTPSDTPVPTATESPTYTPSPTNTHTPTPTLIARIELQQGLGETTTDSNGDALVPVAIRVINTGETPLEDVQIFTNLNQIGSFGDSLKGIIGHRAPFNSSVGIKESYNADTDTEHFAPPIYLGPGEQILVVFTAVVENLTGSFTIPSQVSARSPSGRLSDSDVQTVPLVAPSPTMIPSSTPTDSPTPTFTPTPTDTPVPTNTPTHTPSPTITPSRTPTPTPSSTPTYTLTPTNAPTRTPTPTATRTPSPTLTPTPAVLGAQSLPSSTPILSSTLSPSHSPTPSPNSQPSSTDSGSIRSMQPLEEQSPTPSTTPGSVLGNTDSKRTNNYINQTPTLSPQDTATPTKGQVLAETTLVNTGIPIAVSLMIGSLLLIAVMTIRSVDAVQHRNFTPLPDYIQDELDKLEK